MVALLVSHLGCRHLQLVRTSGFQCHRQEGRLESNRCWAYWTQRGEVATTNKGTHPEGDPTAIGICGILGVTGMLSKYLQTAVAVGYLDGIPQSTY